MKLRLFMVLVAFLAGIAASNLMAGATEFETPVYNGGYELQKIRAQANQEDPSPVIEMPQDRIQESQINVFSDRIVLDIQNAQWSTFTPTKSMVPFLDKGANAIQVAPQEGCVDIQVGDIISYESDYSDGVIIHRVIDKGFDKLGTYFVVKGDNNSKVDPGKVRCSQIKRVLVAIIY